MNESLERVGAAGLAVSPLGVFDSPRYSALAQERAHGYQTAHPFPQAVFDDFVDPEVAHAISAAFPSRAAMGWVDGDNENNRRRYEHDERMFATVIREMLR